jgi:hypothetical protein
MVPRVRGRKVLWFGRFQCDNSKRKKQKKQKYTFLNTWIFVYFNSLKWLQWNKYESLTQMGKKVPKNYKLKESTNIEINQLVQLITKITYSHINKRKIWTWFKPNMLPKFTKELNKEQNSCSQIWKEFQKKHNWNSFQTKATNFLSHIANLSQLFWCLQKES